jgi:hypothetical protein
MFDRMNRHRLPFCNDDDGAGSGGGAGADANDDAGTGNDLEAQITAAVQRETEGLKRTNAALKQEKTRLAERVDVMAKVVERIGGEEGAAALLEMQARLKKDDLGKLLAEGKTEEFLAATTKELKAEHEREKTKLQKMIEELEGGRTAAESAFANLKLEIGVREACAKSEGFRKEAVEDALLFARSQFIFDHERGTPVMKDANGTIVLGKDGETPMTIHEALEAAKESRRHWWEGSQGAGASGGIGGSASANGKRVEDMSMDEYKKYRETQGLGERGARIPG